MNPASVIQQLGNELQAQNERAQQAEADHQILVLKNALKNPAESPGEGWEYKRGPGFLYLLVGIFLYVGSLSITTLVAIEFERSTSKPIRLYFIPIYLIIYLVGVMKWWKWHTIGDLPTILERKRDGCGCIKGNFYYWEKSGTECLGFCTQVKRGPRTRPWFCREFTKSLV